jgi:outer membrane murein-binding lipoprotein Lpp
MKKTIITIAVAVMLISGSVLTGCKSSAQKEVDAQSEVQDAQKDLNDAQSDANAEAQKVATAEEWIAFKIEADAKIKSNEVRIAELTVKMNKPGEILDPIYKKRIQTLEQQNNDLRVRMDAYDKNQSDWETFKREFNHDMDALGQALKDVTVDNTK